MNMAKPLHPVTLVSLAGIPAAALVSCRNARRHGSLPSARRVLRVAARPHPLHLVSDVLIGLAYLAIPVALVHFIRSARDIPFNWMFLLFGLFIVACGATHWMEVLTLWNPAYWVAGAVKAITAAASVPTAILLFLLIPKALALPSIAQLEAAKAALEREVLQRRGAEAALEEARRDLEIRVNARTSELRVAERASRAATRGAGAADPGEGQLSSRSSRTSCATGARHSHERARDSNAGARASVRERGHAIERQVAKRREPARGASSTS
jgi:hypothetical protein